MSKFQRYLALQDLWKPKLLLAVDPISLQKIVVSFVALGMEHGLLISSGFEVFAWGRNHRGQLGLGTTTDVAEPTLVALKACWVACGEDHSCGISAGGEVYTWGNAETGKLGHGSSLIRSAMSFPKQIELETRVKRAACGSLHTALVGTNGELLTFGAGWFGRLGHGDMNNQYSPKLVRQVQPSEKAPRFAEVSCGSFHSCALCEESMLWLCGRDYSVCQADHVTVPLLFNVEDEVVAVAAGANHSLCVSRAGKLWGWGDNSKGQLGQGHGAFEKLPLTLISCRAWSKESKDERNKANKAQKAELLGVSCGYAHSMAFTDAGEVYAWGLQSGGRLALKTCFDSKSCPVPQRVFPAWKLTEKVK